MTHGQGDIVGGVDRIGDEFLLQQGKAFRDHTRRGWMRTSLAPAP